MCRIGHTILDFRLPIGLAALAIQVLTAMGAFAAECGDNSPDYSAQRTLLVNDKAEISKVYVSGLKIREERRSGGHVTVVLRLPEQRLTILYDPERREGWQLPLPPQSHTTKQTRVVIDPHSDGTTVRHSQFQNGGKWIELSATTCSSENIMLEQSFTLIGPQGTW